MRSAVLASRFSLLGSCSGFEYVMLALLLLVVLGSSSPLGAATVDGARIHYTSTGHGAKTLILVHGWTCDESSWSEQAPVLAKKYRVITIDLPGHGKSDQPK